MRCQVWCTAIDEPAALRVVCLSGFPQAPRSSRHFQSPNPRKHASPFELDAARALLPERRTDHSRARSQGPHRDSRRIDIPPISSSASVLCPSPASHVACSFMRRRPAHRRGPRVLRDPAREPRPRRAFVGGQVRDGPGLTAVAAARGGSGFRLLGLREPNGGPLGLSIHTIP